jgi:hypothetical protein
MPLYNGEDTAKGTRERHLTRGTMDVLRKADDGESRGRFHKGELVAGVIIAGDASIRRREYRRQCFTMKRWRERDAGPATSVLVCVH